MGREERGEGVRPPVPDIPGLSKGKIESRRELWASRRRVGFSENRSDIFEITREMELFLSLPVLGVPESEPLLGEISGFPWWMPRMDKPTGTIHLSTWEAREEHDPRTAVIFGGKKFPGRKIPTRVPKKIPASWTVARLIPQEHKTIESAIEAAEKIAAYEGVGGPAQRRVETLFAALNSISEAFLYEEMTPLRLEGLSRQAESLLREHGLLTARDKIWKRIADRTLRAASRTKDDRINPMISRILARAAYLDAVHMESRQRAAREKALKLFFWLTEIRSDSRSKLENTEMALDRLGGFAYAKPVAALSGETRWLNPRDALPIELGLIALGKDLVSFEQIVNRKRQERIVKLVSIEAAPYGPAARLAEAILVGRIGKSNEEIRALSELLTAKGRRELGRRSAVDYFMQGDAISGRKRMHQAFAEIHKGLEGKPKSVDS